MSDLTTIKEQPASAQIPPADEINPIEYLAIVARRRWMIMRGVAIATVLSVVVALLLPNIYVSSARVLPPAESGSSGLSSLLGGGVGELASMAGVSVGGGGSGPLWAGMLRSRTVSDAIIKKFDLQTVYGEKYLVRTRDKLAKFVRIEVGAEDGILAIAVEDQDPKRASDIANAYLEQLQELNNQFNLANAGRERVFLENRLALVRKDLNAAEERLKDFQLHNKAIKLDVQAAAIIEAIAQLKAEEAAKEVELSALSSYQSRNSPQVMALKGGLARLREEIKKLERAPAGQGGDSILFSTSEVPELGLQYARVMRDFKIQESLFNSLTAQFEMAKIAEAKNSAALQILDRAEPPDAKTRPIRSLMVLVTMVVSGVFCVMWAFVLEALPKLNEADQQRLSEVLQMFKFRLPWRRK